MPYTIYVVQGFRGGRKVITQCFQSEESARARAAPLGQTFDGVVMWRHTTDMETGFQDGPNVLMNVGTGM
jgi:hypothetical protein